MFRTAASLSLILLLSGCATSTGGPSLAPRAAEALDPRLPVADHSATLAPDAALSAELAALRTRALAAAERAEPAISAAVSASRTAGPAASERWVAAQQLVSAAVAERSAFAAVLADLDTLLAQRVREGKRLAPSDIAAAQAILTELAAIDRRQAETLAEAQRQLVR